MLANGASLAESPHESNDATRRTLFVDTRLTPEICNVHPVVSVHCVVRVSAPFIVNAPTKYEKSAKPPGACDQHML
jgi:hypothetical protein